MYPWVVLLTNVDQAWKKIEECGNLVGENMAKMLTSKCKVGGPLLVMNGVITPLIGVNKNPVKPIYLRPFIGASFKHGTVDASEIQRLHQSTGSLSLSFE